jgi:hypothetical protein
MPDIQVSLLAILCATVAGFFISFLWYSPLFGKLWAQEMCAMARPEAAGMQLFKSLALTVSVFLIAFVLSHNIAAWTPSTWGATQFSISKTAQAAQAGLFTWLGFFVSGQFFRVAWERRS